MIRNHQTIPGILEKGIQEANSTRIKLLGPQPLTNEAKFQYLNTDEATTIAENHEDGQYVFYVLEEHSEKEIVSVEKGVGKLEKEENGDYINRLMPWSQGNSWESVFPTRSALDLEANRDTFLIIGTASPSNVSELLFEEHSVATSSEKGPQTTPMQENTLLGRLDGDIQALNLSELAQLLGLVSPNVIRLAPSQEPTEPAEGMIYYDWDRGTFRGYDRTGWREI